MKKLLFILAIAAFATGAQAQTSGAIVTTIPANFTAVDQVKIIVDVSNVGNLKDREPLYVWTWHPNDPLPGNGDWGNSASSRMMVKEGPNKWSWTVKPAEFYKVTPADITQMRFLVKAKDGTGDLKSTDIELNIQPLIFTPTAFRTFPSVAGQDEILKVYLDQTLVTNDLPLQRMTPVSADVFLYSTTNELVGNAVNKPLQNVGNKLYSFAVFPRGDFPIPAGVKINKMVVIYKGTMLDVNGTAVSANSQPFEKLFDDLK